MPAEVDALVLQCLAKDPASRVESAHALRDAIDRCADAGRWTERDAAAWWQAAAS